ncbi:DUF1127 domain-containing protein [Salipiger mucosus]|uniref:YjiS-like domain-containing protein n=1 Tax=Salipiger mucosus DSM 16094 TaxID=1123237 RepID=S9RDI4_9RHOB|nr:DUF1127 domain-containing protein [Salipiger mucosus]EPX76190.1 hypothetical protein Salmuc_01974 [Salipiger mucosus DSM 16094]
MAQTAHAPHLAYLGTQHPLPLTADIALRLAVVLARWSERSRTRRALVKLDDHLLRDVGLERDAALKEARRMFWQG